MFGSRAVKLTSKCHWSLFTICRPNLIQANGTSNQVIFEVRSKHRAISPCHFENGICFTRLYFIQGDLQVIKKSSILRSVKECGVYHTQSFESMRKIYITLFDISVDSLPGPRFLVQKILLEIPI